MLNLYRSTQTMFNGPTVNFVLKPALGGVWFEVYVDGHVTDTEKKYQPLMGSLQFNLEGSASLIWPVFELKMYDHPPQFLSQHGSRLSYAGLVSYSQLEAFEKERNGKDFQVQVCATLRVLTDQGELEDWTTSGRSLHKTAQEWISNLSQARYKSYLFHELEFPAVDTYKADSVYHLLSRARERFDKGMYRDCVACLRQAEERLRERRKDKTTISNATKAYKADREAMMLPERMLFLRDAINNALHTASHEQEPDESFDRKTAKALLTMVSALVELYPEPVSN